MLLCAYTYIGRPLWLQFFSIGSGICHDPISFYKGLKNGSFYIDLIESRVVLILGIFKFLRWQRFIWFEINKNKISAKFQVSISILICAAQRCKFHILNNMGFWALNDQFFIPAKVMVQKIWNPEDFILIIVIILQNFYRFLAIIILESITY